LVPTIRQGLATDAPTIIDCVVNAHEMPNFPHLDLDQAGNYAAAKIKEAILAVTGP
jgi:pyruvate dehydrogenase (quinone)